MSAVPLTMRAVLLTGHGGLEKLVYRDDVPVPQPGSGEVLIKVAACGVNNTDINTRTAWYSDTVTSGITVEGGTSGFETVREDAASWGRIGLSFPRIQGADAVGRIVAVGDGVSTSRIGERVMVDGWLRDPDDPVNIEKAGYFGSECDGDYIERKEIKPVVAAIYPLQELVMAQTAFLDKKFIGKIVIDVGSSRRIDAARVPVQHHGSA